jgi:hypothetical protein
MVTLQQVHDGFGAWMAFPRSEDAARAFELLDVTFATVIANRMSGDPCWVFLVAPPSSGKTEVLRALGNVPDVFPLSSLTPQTFASGFERRDVETSLLPQLSNKVIVLKDFGTVLSMHREARAEILAALREIYDGSYIKQWGNGKKFSWEGKVGLLAGCTPIIDRPGESALSSALGERFLQYRVRSAPARTLARRAMAQQSSPQHETRAALQQMVAAFLVDLLPIAPPMPEAIQEGIAALSEFTAMARSPVFTDPRNGEVDLVPPCEQPGRLAKQLNVLAQALAIVRGEHEVSGDTYATVLQIGQDSMPAPRRIMLEALLARADSRTSTTTIAEATKYPTSTCRRYLLELHAIGFVDRHPEGPGKPDTWSLSDHLVTLHADVRAPIQSPETCSTASGRVQ